MAVEIALNTPLADALNNVIRPKLLEVGWATGGGDEAALSEYILLMLVNNKTQQEIASELAGDLLNLGPDDPGALEFAQWLFGQIDALTGHQNSGGAAPDQAGQAAGMAMDQDMDMNASPTVTELNAYAPRLHSCRRISSSILTSSSPTGPKSMRNGDMRGGSRGKRILGQANRAMDRSHDSVLHRVRGNDRVNMRQPPTGPRGAGRMGNRGGMNNNRANNIAHGMAAQMHAMNSMNMADPNFQMIANNGPQGDIYALLQQQNQMMAALSQQLAESQRQNQHSGRGRGGKSLFERTDRGSRGGFRDRRGGNHNNHHSRQDDSANGAAEGDDVDMGDKQPSNPEASICKYNLSCTNRECKFAHQSPAAPPGITVDVNDTCTYGAACKNFKCVAKHPSPATRRAHQSEQECKFYPNCQNPKCPFKHPGMPMCRNGADCKTEGCTFTHLQTMCKFKPCTNRYCAYKHEEGQRGTFQDKVWTANGTGNHVSERQFVGADDGEEMVVPGSEHAAMDEGIA
jgi:nuclear polyadenylated RNA-binding protein NAB2